MFIIDEMRSGLEIMGKWFGTDGLLCMHYIICREGAGIQQTEAIAVNKVENSSIASVRKESSFLEILEPC